MTDREKRAKEYLEERTEYSEMFDDNAFVVVDMRTAMVEFAEKETKELEKENAELKEQHRVDLIQVQAILNQRSIQNTKLTEAKELIENIIRVTWGEGWNYSLDWKVKAEQFLKGVEK